MGNDSIYRFIYYTGLGLAGAAILLVFRYLWVNDPTGVALGALGFLAATGFGLVIEIREQQEQEAINNAMRDEMNYQVTQMQKAPEEKYKKGDK